MKLSYYSLFLYIAIFEEICVNISIGDPTDGFTILPYSLVLQKPYDKALEQRYSNIDGIQRFWVNANDKPFKQNTNTKPRTEARVQGQDYASGIRQFEGNVYIPSGTSGVSIMQIFGRGTGSSNLQLRVYNGEIKYYNDNVVESNVYNKWLRLNVIHNVNKGQIAIFINGVQKLQVREKGPGNMYFKFGVYTQKGSSHLMESRWKNVTVYRK